MTGMAGQAVGVPDSRLHELISAFERLGAIGELDRRDTNLLAIIGLSRSELVHSQVVRWLLDPSASHGLGPNLLGDVLSEGWDDGRREGLEKAVVTTEQGHIQTRADVVAEMGQRVLVVENKIDAPEQPTQCDDLYVEWGADAYFLFLSPSGGLPRSAVASRPAWRSLSYRGLAAWLRDHLDDVSARARGPVADYLTALEQQFPGRSEFTVQSVDKPEPPATEDGIKYTGFDAPNPFETPRLRFYLEHRETLREIELIEAEYSAGFGREIQSLVGPIQDELVTRFGPVLAGITSWKSGVKPHPMFWRAAWEVSPNVPAAAIVLAWESGDPTRRGPWSGLCADRNQLHGRLKDWLRSDFAERHAKSAESWIEGMYPVAYRFVTSPAEWWHDLPGWRRQLAGDVAAAWERFADSVDAGFAALGAERVRADG